jgi:G3E family GTPase
VNRTPVTILTGFLGSGKTTLLKRILSEQHGERIAVIENEFGEAGIDGEVLREVAGEQIIEMNNGCICCTVRGDLVRILKDLHRRRAANEIVFDRVLIETTGLADPAPVAQAFFANLDVARSYILDAVVTLVDARHGSAQLAQHSEAQAQVGFADRILISKTDLTHPEQTQALETELTGINPRARTKRVHFGATDIADLLDLRAFDIEHTLELDPQFLERREHRHAFDIGSLLFREQRALDLERFDVFMGLLLRQHSDALMRYKGVLNIAGRAQRMILQGVHAIMEAGYARAWGPQEQRETVIVFIGRDLPRQLIEDGLRLCLAQ